MIKNTCLAMCAALSLLGGNVLVASETSETNNLPDHLRDHGYSPEDFRSYSLPGEEDMSGSWDSWTGRDRG